LSAKTFILVACVLVAGYAGYQKLHVPKGGEQAAAGGGNILEASNPAFYGTMEPGGPVLRAKRETMAKLGGMTQSRVVMFATGWCPYCAKARDVFKAHNVRYTEFDLEHDGAAAEFQEKVLGLSGFPTIIIGNRVTQGFDEGQILASLKEL